MRVIFSRLRAAGRETLVAGLEVVDLVVTLRGCYRAGGLGWFLAGRQYSTAQQQGQDERRERSHVAAKCMSSLGVGRRGTTRDRKSTRLNSSHQIISYAV